MLDQLHRAAPDLLLLDWLMPQGGGQRVIEALRSGVVPRTRVILMTGSPDEHLPVSMDRLPVLHKPFRLHDLQSMLGDVQPGAVPKGLVPATGLS